MANLGSIAVEFADYNGSQATQLPNAGWRLQKIVLVDFLDTQFGSTLDASVYGDTAPSLGMTRFGRFSFPVVVKAGSRTVSAKVKQTLPSSPMPRITVLANPAIGLDADVNVDAATGTGWQTLTASFDVDADGVVNVELWCLAPGTQVACWWDDITTR